VTVSQTPASTAKDLLTFGWGSYAGTIYEATQTVVLTVPYTTDLATLNPYCTASPLATISPASGDTVDFTDSEITPVPYTVTAQDTSTKVYDVIVTKVPASTACDMLTITAAGSPGVISGTNVTLMVPYGTDVTTLAPTYTVSQFASEDPTYPSGTARNFTTPQSYTITAQDGVTDQTYTVTVYQLAAPGTIATVPPGLNPGDTYRLVFVTSTTRDAASANIADYNTHVSAAAAAVTELNALGTTWTCIGSTNAVNANANTLTRASDPSAPIYRLDGAPVATGNTDLWDGSIANAIKINELGNAVDVYVWTGTIGQGTKWGGHPLGDAPGWVIHGDSLGTVSTLTDRDVYGHGWVGNVGNAGSGSNPNPLYAISGILTVPGATAPTAPTITGITPGDTTLSVAFTAPSSDGGAAITNYKYSTDDGSTWTAVSPAATTSPILISGLTNGTPYQVKILAVNSVGDGAPSDAVSGTPAAGTSYATWAAANGASNNPLEDSNHNGVPNGIEHFMGATPGNPAVLPPLVDNAGTWTWTIPYDPAALASYYFRVSDDLSPAGWTDIAPPDASITVLTTPDRIQFTLPAGTGKKFCRLLVTPN
jgi:hypothetical protein